MKGGLAMNVVRRSSGQWVFGLIILMIGIIFLLENVFAMEIWEGVWLFWPVVFLLWGLMELFQKKSIFFGLILLAIGVLFLGKNFGFYQWSETIWNFWPVIIIAIGLDQLFKHPETVSIGRKERKQREKKGREEVITQDDEII